MKLSFIALITCTVFSIMLTACLYFFQFDEVENGFSYEVIDARGVGSPWAKGHGDLNGDGLPDVVVGGRAMPPLSFVNKVLNKLNLIEVEEHFGALVWYENPSWKRNLISTEYAVRTDVEVVDLDQDGKNDLLFISDEGLFWLKNPTWEAHKIVGGKFHDVEVADLDLDGDMDLVLRNQSLFGYENGDSVHLMFQSHGSVWETITLSIIHGEGLAVTDMNSDGFPDVVVNQFWLANPGTAWLEADWVRHVYAVDWLWQDVFIDTEDFNADGHMDILLSPSEEAGQMYDIAWFEAPAHEQGSWKKHLIDQRVEAVHHFVAAGDIDLDGDIDVVSAEMNQGEDPDEVKWYQNLGDGLWEKKVLSDRGSHNMQLFDIDQDFDLDLVGANWHRTGWDAEYPVELWRNNYAESTVWNRYLIDESRPGQAVSVFSVDLNGDSLLDVVTGGYWYQNPGTMEGDWPRFALGDGAFNVAWVDDFDADGHIDFLASGWIGYHHKSTWLDRILNRLGVKKFPYTQEGNRFVWGQNRGDGTFRLHDNIALARGDFLQGAASLTVVPDKQASDKKHVEQTSVLLSWHTPGMGLQQLIVPDDPVNEVWVWSVLDQHSLDEQVSVVDLNQDGLQDIVLGTDWFRRIDSKREPITWEGEDWLLNKIDHREGKPDRHQVLDIDSDGLLDIVVGFESAGVLGEFVWYQQPRLEGSRAWLRYSIANDVIGPMSLGAADLDGNGTEDLVVGEHNLVEPDRSRLIWFKRGYDVRKPWQKRLIYLGDEHHNGALPADFDGDGDIDLVSIGWTHGRVMLYENPLY